MALLLIIITYAFFFAVEIALTALGALTSYITAGIHCIINTCRNDPHPWRRFFNELWHFTKKTVHWIGILTVAFFTAAMINWIFFE